MAETLLEAGFFFIFLFTSMPILMMSFPFREDKCDYHLVTPLMEWDILYGLTVLFCFPKGLFFPTLQTLNNITIPTWVQRFVHPF